MSKRWSCATLAAGFQCVMEDASAHERGQLEKEMEEICDFDSRVFFPNRNSANENYRNYVE